MIEKILEIARAASEAAPPVGDPAYPLFAATAAELLQRRWGEVLDANDADLAAAVAAGSAPAMVERMRLTDQHREALVELTHRVCADLPGVTAPGPETEGIGGSRAHQVARPLGVLLMVYESRPMVTLDSAVLAVCTGNAVLLRGGSECLRANGVLAELISDALRARNLPEGLAQVLLDTDRAQLRDLLRRDDAIDVLVPRGGAGLVDYCRTASRVPVIAGGAGVNHLYVHSTADIALAVRLVLDSKLPDPAGCTALEMLLLDEDVADGFFAELVEHVDEPDVRTLMLRLTEETGQRLPQALEEALEVQELAANDDGREFLDPTLAVRVVPGIAEAVRHVRRFGTGHTDGIVARSRRASEEFCARVDSAAVVVNGSLRLHDGPSLGMGPEIAISTGRLHVRGPVGLDSLLSRSWVVQGAGAVRFRTGGTEGKGDR
ncbi:glutamate-5-semialdehyde dehydrogenase [Umezawaea sp. Da 62-37]|uniref:glutamate-5-semialdehyde dehydrogenase n=1 Tax=Umezawaea sp. Da 62-37 TaxID=3075927 RepID=UPI0028F7246D|nr:glutamate-5-semialdehyde dehydrogenase [Umezawaea sp. Da 62-37]WNV85125.1 glutamate-5-semialdehyde dehydrogenase [Umezawaea sp. Da 62-37]